MKIKILEINFQKKNKIIVYFSCTIGEGIGVWKSQDKVYKGMEADVELDVYGTLSVNEDINLVEEQEEKIYIMDNQVHIRGRIEQIDWDNLITVRLGRSILLIDVDDVAFLGVNKWIDIKTKELELTEVIF